VKANTDQLSPLRVIGDPAFGNRDHNPYNSLLYTHLAACGVEVVEYDPARVLSGEYAIWHIHWPESPLWGQRFRGAARQLIRKLRLVRQARRQGTKIVWTTHNLRSHDRLHPWLERVLWRVFVNEVDGFISPSDAAMRAALQRFPRLRGVPGFVVYHGHYRELFAEPEDRATARERLGLPGEAKVFVFFGQIRPYKDVPALLAAFQRLQDPDVLLIVAGEPAVGLMAADLHRLAQRDSRIRLDLRRVPADVLQRYASAADLIVLPFRAVLNSGSALLALSLDRPVLLPRQGAMGELQEVVGEAWVRTYPGSLNSDELAAAMQWASGTHRGAKAPLEAFAWDVIASRTIAAYQAILDGASIHGSPGSPAQQAGGL
jgi:beta-1,4-mannosyltransferase